MGNLMGNLSCTRKTKEEKNDPPYTVATDTGLTFEVEKVQRRDNEDVKDTVATDTGPTFEVENVQRRDNEVVEESLEESRGAEYNQQHGNVINIYTIKANNVNVGFPDETTNGDPESISTTKHENIPETIPVQVSNDVNESEKRWVDWKPVEHYKKRNEDSIKLITTEEQRADKINLSINREADIGAGNDLLSMCETNNTESIQDGILMVDSHSSLPNSHFSVVEVRPDSSTSDGGISCSRDESEMHFKGTVKHASCIVPDQHELNSEQLFVSNNEHSPTHNSAGDDVHEAQDETGGNVEGRDGQIISSFDENDDDEEDTTRFIEDRGDEIQNKVVCNESTQHNSPAEVENENEQSQNERSCQHEEIDEAIEVDAEMYTEEIGRASVNEGDRDGESSTTMKIGRESVKGDGDGEISSKKYPLVSEMFSKSITEMSDLSKDGTGKVHSIAMEHENSNEVKTECAKEIGNTTRSAVNDMAVLAEHVVTQCLRS